MATAAKDSLNDDDEPRAIVHCDDCGKLIYVPEDMAAEVNFCRECSPTTEDYDPEDDDTLSDDYGDDAYGDDS